MIEAPRGTLIHHYEVDPQGAITSANLIVATGHNSLAISLSVQRVSKHYVDVSKLNGHAKPRFGLRPLLELLDTRIRHARSRHSPAKPRRLAARSIVHRLTVPAAGCTNFLIAPIRASESCALSTHPSAPACKTVGKNCFAS